MLISTSDICKSYGTEVILENVSFDMAEKDKIGLIGSNGAGKTTLFRILTDEESADSGEIYKQKNIRIGYMRQHSDFTSKETVYNEVLKVFSHLVKTERELEDIVLSLETKDGNTDELIKRQVYLTEKFKNDGGYIYKSKLRSVLMGLGFGEDDFHMPLSSLSGGQRTRLLLARLLLEEPELLLLDEPTNHLDIPSVSWLEDYLMSYNGGLIVISHDRYFLDKVTNRTMEIEGHKLSCYKGNYSKYLVQKQELTLHKTRVFENTTAEITRLKGIIEQQRRWNREKNIKTAESKQKIVDKLIRELEAPQKEQETMQFSFKANRTSGNDVLSVRNLKKSFEGKEIFRDATLDVRRKDRIFLLGPNGCGKTTFIKTLLSKYTPNGGDFRFGVNVDVGYYDQLGETLTPENTIIEEVWEAFPSLTHTQVRCVCGAFLFSGEDVFKQIKDLSGGEKARVTLIKLSLSGSNFLILDEPTNHLDIASREVLEKAFSEYEGSMLVISHDRYFINKLATTICEMTPKGIKRYNGNYDYYLEKSVFTENNNSPLKEERKQSTGNDYKEQKELVKRKRKLENTIKKCEEELEKLDKEISDLKSKLELPEIGTDYTKAMEISEKIEELTNLYEEEFLRLDEAEAGLKDME